MSLFSIKGVTNCLLEYRTPDEWGLIISLLTKDSMEKDDKALGLDGAIGNCGFERVVDLNASLECDMPAIETEFDTVGILSFSLINVGLFSVDIKFNKEFFKPVSFALFEPDVLVDITRSEFSACEND